MDEQKIVEKGESGGDIWLGIQVRRGIGLGWSRGIERWPSQEAQNPRGDKRQTDNPSSSASDVR